MAAITCPYLNGKVELTGERERHIAEHHPDLLPEHRGKIDDTLAAPDQVRRSLRNRNARLFARWFSDLKGGKHMVVVVVSDPDGDGRNWIITAYLTGALTGGEIEWKRS